MEEQKVSKADPFAKKINRILFHYKDLITYSDNFYLDFNKSNISTKILCKNQNASKPFVLLFCSSEQNESYLTEIAIACIKSCDSSKKVTTNIKVNNRTIESLCAFIKESEYFIIEYKKDFLYLSKNNNESIKILEVKKMDKPSIFSLVASLSILLASCSKTVTNNIDSMELNDYGCIDLGNLFKN